MIRGLIHRGLLQAARLPVARAAVFAAEAARYRLHHPDSLGWRRLAEHYPRWRNSQRHRTLPLAEGSAWLTFGAIDFLDSKLDRNARVFEYGAGGSTIFIASRAGELISVEHDGTWANEVTAALAARGLRNVTVLHIEPEDVGTNHVSGDPDGYRSTDADSAGKEFRRYASAIDSYPDAYFHVILVDGRARPSCVRHAIPKLAAHGILILDNAERAQYAPARGMLDALGWTRVDFAGPGPVNMYFWKTSAWERP